MFLYDKKPILYCKTYTYLGCLIQENLDFRVTVGSLVDSAGRALGSIITKMIKNGGFPYSVFCTLYESCVSSISDYAGEVFGFNEFDAEMKLHLRAIRSFLGVSKSTAHSGLLSEFNILMPHYRTQLRMIRYYHRMLKCQTNVLAKKIFIWDRNLNKKQCSQVMAQ